MLYDPKWSETKADPFSLESLIAWLEKQDGARTYDYCDSGSYIGESDYSRALALTAACLKAQARALTQEPMS